jgi:glycosyltransferase involved in cell wall biosynthesis
MEIANRIAVIIPALNEAGNIGRLVAEVLETDPFDVDQRERHQGERQRSAGPTQAPAQGEQVRVIVVDNGSTDATAQEARAAGAEVVHEARRGYGYACAAGVTAAGEADVLVFLDGDYSSLPAELPVVLAPILSGKADLVLGSRTRGHIAPGAMPPQQRFGNWLASRLMRRLYGLTVTDLGPYRAIRRSLLAALDMREMTYGWPTEMTVKAARRGARLVEVPVSWHPRQAGRSKVSGTLRGTILAARYILGVTLRYAWRKPREQ